MARTTQTWLDGWRAWQFRTPPTPPDAFLSAELDAGEAAVITLAKELGIGVLMDERKGRRVAALAYGLHVLGTGRILLEAKERRLIEQVRPLVEQMHAGGYYLSERLKECLCPRRRQLLATRYSLLATD